ncbi:MAG: hypothetical protein AAGA54_33990 [Myxococcota bacterium]
MMRGAFLLGVFTLAGCMTGDGMASKIRDTSSAYNRALRWGDIDRAVEYVPPQSRDLFLDRHELSEEKLVVVEYEVTRLDLDRERGVAASRAEIVWHTDRELVVERTMVDQLWQYHEGEFVLVDERRAGGTPLSIFAEVAEDPHPYLPGLEAYRKQHKIGEKNKYEGGKRRRKKDKSGSQLEPVATR